MRIDMDKVDDQGVLCGGHYGGGRCLSDPRGRH